MPENLPGDPAATVPIPLRRLRRCRRVYYPDGERETDGDEHELFYTRDETVLQWLGPDGVWRDVPLVEEGTSDEQS